MDYIFPLNIPSTEAFGSTFTPSVWGIPSGESFGTVNIPKFAGITSGEAFGHYTKIGIWWLVWRAFDNKFMYTTVSKAFSTTVERYEFTENLILENSLKFRPRPDWKFKTAIFGMPVLPKNNLWNKQTIYLRDQWRV